MLFLVVCLLAALITPVAEASVYARGYYRADGTCVMPHFRSEPDGYFWNNWSSWGNYNPYTGQRGYRTYDSYLRSRLTTDSWSYSYPLSSYSSWGYDWRNYSWPSYYNYYNSYRGYYLGW